MKRRVIAATIAATLSLCRAQSPSSQLVAEAARDYWQYTLHDSLDLRLKLGLPIENLPDVSFEKSQADARFAQTLLTRMAKIAPAQLTHDEWISYELLKFQDRSMIDGAPYIRLRFQVTPYASPIPLANRVFTSYKFGQASDLSTYLALLNKYPSFIDTIGTNLKTQRDRGIVLPKPEIDGVLRFLSSYIKAPEQSLFYVTRDRLQSIREVEKFQTDVAGIIRDRINPELQSLVDFLNGDYRLRARDTVGLSQYPQGADFYRYLVKFHTTLDTTPEAVHQLGLKLVNDTQAKMDQVKQQLGHSSHRKEFASTPDEMAAALSSFTAQAAPKLGTLFLHLPRAPYGIQRLDPALEGAQTFGYYRDGIYYYNGSDLPHRSLLSAGVLILHELVPGHHLQMSLQSENTQLPDFRRYAYYTAYGEGWGTYASRLGEDMKLYDDPYDYYGYLAMMQFFNVRLVVDTGMNAFGWSRARASQFMREHLLESDAQIATETLRYSVDLPGQALAYRIGANQILELRQIAREALGAKFDIREFHDWILGSGPMPLTVLKEHVAWNIAQKRDAH